MEFRTTLPIRYSGLDIDHSKRGFIVGSCFAENISARLASLKFPVVSNPFGIMFNPASIYEMCIAIDAEKEFSEIDLDTDGHLWFSYDHHGVFSRSDWREALEIMNKAVAAGHEALRAADYVIFTFGTSWVYRLNSTGRVVANCHKTRQDAFTRHRLSIDEIVVPFSNLLQGRLAQKKVIFTVSPVRHLKDGFAENSLSKAILRAAIGQLEDAFDNAYYFPSFEILNDDLRDYRFYCEDMVHPSTAAVEYIWEKFASYALTPQTRELLPRLEKLRSALNHSPLTDDPSLLAPFHEKMRQHILTLVHDLPGVDFRAEMDFFSL